MKSKTIRRRRRAEHGARCLLGAMAAIGVCGCAGTQQSATTAPAPTATAKATSTKTPGSPGSPSPTRVQPLGSSLDPAGMEISARPISRGANDTIVANTDNVPASFATTGSGVQGMTLDVMESLAQVTFAKQGSDFDPSISRDGLFLVYASTQHRPTADIYVKSVTGRTVTQLTADPSQDVMPSLSPDGKRVAFASNRTGTWDIYVMSIIGGQAVQITNDPTQELHPSWSADGQRLVYCKLGEMSGRWEMWVMDIEQPMVSEFIGYGLFPSWCPVAGTGEGGRDKILFQRSRERGDRAFTVWTIDYKPGDASSPTEIASSQSAAVINPTWSADGQRIVFAGVPFSPEYTNNPGAKPTVADLWMCNVDGSGRVNLTTGRSVNLMPSWSPDGRIYFVSDRGGVDNIWSIGTEKAILAATGGKGMENNMGMPTGHDLTKKTSPGKNTHEKEVTSVPESGEDRSDH